MLGGKAIWIAGRCRARESVAAPFLGFLPAPQLVATLLSSPSGVCVDHGADMLRQSYEVWISCDGVRIQEFSKKLKDGGRVVECCIPSESGKVRGYMHLVGACSLTRILSDLPDLFYSLQRPRKEESGLFRGYTGR